MANLVFEELLSFTHESEVYKVALPQALDGQSFRWLLRELNDQQQAVLLSVQRGKQIHTNPQSEFLLQEGDELFVLAKNAPEHLERVAPPARQPSDPAVDTESPRLADGVAHASKFA